MDCKHDNYTKKKDIVKCKNCGISGGIVPDGNIIWDDYSCSHQGEFKILKTVNNYSIYGKGKWIASICLNKEDGWFVNLLGVGNNSTNGYIGLLNELASKDELVECLRNCLVNLNQYDIDPVYGYLTLRV